MKPTQMRQLSQDEIENKLHDWQQDLFHARCKQGSGQLENTSTLRFLRRDIARAKTLLGQLTRQPDEQDASSIDPA